MKKEWVNELFRRLAEADPEPKTELDFTNEFTLLVAIVLSAQATDKGVNKATPALFRAADTPEKMAQLGEAKIRNYIKTIGLFNGKAKNVHALSKILINKYDSKVPHEAKELESLPGVGSKTAAVWQNCALGIPRIAVDTHVFRVGNRTGLCTTKTADATQTKLEKIVPDQWKLHAHHWLILHGRYTCVARKPKCDQCIIIDLCKFKGKTV